jgi:hypothetical protein
MLAVLQVPFLASLKAVGGVRGTGVGAAISGRIAMRVTHQDFWAYRAREKAAESHAVGFAFVPLRRANRPRRDHSAAALRRDDRLLRSSGRSTLTDALRDPVSHGCRAT